ncbi:MAG: DUF6288 domain-containing protein, partial [Verrucomicrobiota bacterium]
MTCMIETGNARRMTSLGLALLLTSSLLAAQRAGAAPPDLTVGGVPDNNRTQNLGPTGARAWIYCDGTVNLTTESRQFLITEIDPGSPADGVLAVDDVILGADGTGAPPTLFTNDARHALARAIADAEARSPATLRLLYWRAGATNEYQLTLQTIGAYSPTAPYDCPKSSNILARGMQQIYDNEDSGRYNYGALALLAWTNTAYYGRVQTEMRDLVPDPDERAEMMSDQRSTANCWERGHKLLVLSEYYLATGDTNVLPGIEARATEFARNQSMFGTVGHMFADKHPDGSDNWKMGGVYGVINNPGLLGFLGILLAERCGVTNPYIAPAIERTSRFFSYYAGRGSIPYGEHVAWIGRNGGANGKDALAALAFSLQTNRVTESRYFSKVCASASRGRESGHTGPYFEYLWGPLGANAGGGEATISFFDRIKWHLDLQRRWDGSFAYDNLASDGGAGNGTRYYDFSMTGAAMLTYAIPYGRLHITSTNQSPPQVLGTND